MSDSSEKNEYRWEDWKKQPWATREAKRTETPLDEKSENWQKERNEYNANPQQYTSEYARFLESRRRNIDIGLLFGHFAKISESDSPGMRTLQDTVNALVQAYDPSKRCPELVYYTPLYEAFDISKGEGIYAIVPEYIFLGAKMVDYCAAHPDQFKAVAAHELAHLANGDTIAKNTISKLINPPNHKREVLADRMGAIIHGNPKEYARGLSKFLLDTQSDSANQYSQQHPSNNNRARMLHKWADMLQEAGATDKKTGEIIDRNKAMEVYERSRELTRDLTSAVIASRSL